jgi:hypothetical protein
MIKKNAFRLVQIDGLDKFEFEIEDEEEIGLMPIDEFNKKLEESKNKEQ